MKWLALLSLLAAPAARGAGGAPDVRIWRAPDGPRRFVFASVGEGALLSESCRTKLGTFDCEAYRALWRSSKRAIQKALAGRGSINPGWVACQTVGGASVVLEDERRNQNSFCGFSDGSMIDGGAIYASAGDNDQRGGDRKLGVESVVFATLPPLKACVAPHWRGKLAGRYLVTAIIGGDGRVSTVTSALTNPRALDVAATDACMTAVLKTLWFPASGGVVLEWGLHPEARRSDDQGGPIRLETIALTP